MSQLLEKIRSRGYWKVIVRPSVFERDKIPDISSLWSILEKAVVRMRGWDFPHLEYTEECHIDLDWIGQEYEWEHHKSAWRFYQSGQFVHIHAIRLDWRDESSIWPADDAWKPGELLGVGDTIFTMREVMKLASGLALSEAGGSQMHIKIVACNIEGRFLYVDSKNRWPFDRSYSCGLEEFPQEFRVSGEEIVAQHRELALTDPNWTFLTKRRNRFTMQILWITRYLTRSMIGEKPDGFGLGNSSKKAGNKLTSLRLWASAMQQSASG